MPLPNLRLTLYAESTAEPKQGIFDALTLDLTPLKTSREFRLLYTGQFVSLFGSAMSYVVLPWQLYHLTKSPFAVGMLGLAEFVPTFFMAFVGGALADYIDRRRLVLLAEAAMLLCCAALTINALLPQPRVWVLFTMAALNGLHRPALEAMTARLVAPERMMAAGALTMFRYSFNYIIGQSLAGLIVAGLGAAAAFCLGRSNLYRLALDAVVDAASAAAEKR